MLSRSVNSSVKRQILTGSQFRFINTTSILNQQATPNKVESLESTTTSPVSLLSWTKFFELRKQQRNINLASSVTTAIVASSVSWNVLANVEIDPTQLIFGFDPFMIFFAGFITSGGFGFLIGPIFGDLLFKLKNKTSLKAFEVRDKEFLNKIVKNRVDPSSQSFSNPVPDYYGEKILSLKSYRDWLRDCNAYRRKAKEFL